MLDSRFIYDIDATTLPLSKSLLKTCLDNAPIYSFVLCRYEELISTIRMINAAPEIPGTLNAQALFDAVNNPTTNYDCVIKIEGLKKSHDNYLDAVLRSKEDFSWTDFRTYSNEMKREIRGLKDVIFMKTLWNQDNIESWMEVTGMDFPDSLKNKLITDWEMFKSYVVRTKDRDQFISSCTDDSKKAYRELIYKNAENILNRYKVEIMAHAQQKNKNDENVDIMKPVVSKIYITSNNYAKCQRDWPMLRVSPLIKRNLETLGLYL